MYAVTSIWLVSLTRATFRRAEFGFFGVVVYTRVHTPRRCGLPLSAGVLFLATLSWRPLRTNCWIVGTTSPCPLLRRTASTGLVSGDHIARPPGVGAGRGCLTATPAVGRVGPVPPRTIRLPIDVVG